MNLASNALPLRPTPRPGTQSLPPVSTRSAPEVTGSAPPQHRRPRRVDPPRAAGYDLEPGWALVTLSSDRPSHLTGGTRKSRTTAPGREGWADESGGRAGIARRSGIA